MTTATHHSIDEERLHSFQNRVLQDVASVGGIACAFIGDKLGLYKAMAKSGPVTSAALADLTSTNERYIREWLINQAAGGYVSYDISEQTYSLSKEHAMVLADEDSPFFACGGFQTFLAFMHAAPRIVECMKTGAGLPWGEQHAELFEGTERFFRPAYTGCLVQQWIPAIPQLKEKLESGLAAADIGCGHGVSTMVMAKAFPNSRFFGFDSHGPSIEKANAAAQKQGLSAVSFHQANALEITALGAGGNYDLITFFDCLHDMGDPVGACRRAKAVLKPDGFLMIVEPMGGQTTEQNFNEIGRAFAGASVLCCTPNAIASGGSALGTIATDDELRKVVNAAGFSKFERVTETPFNRVFQARV